MSMPRGVEVGGLSEHVADSASQPAGWLSWWDLEPGLVCLRKLGMASVAAELQACGKWWGRRRHQSRTREALKL